MAAVMVMVDIDKIIKELPYFKEALYYNRFLSFTWKN
jgi:hypothetical protein